MGQLKFQCGDHVQDYDLLGTGHSNHTAPYQDSRSIIVIRIACLHEVERNDVHTAPDEKKQNF